MKVEDILTGAAKAVYEVEIARGSTPGQALAIALKVKAHPKQGRGEA